MDFDEVFSSKSLPMWWKATHPTPKAAAVEAKPAVSAQRFNQYTGAPLSSEEPKK